MKFIGIKSKYCHMNQIVHTAGFPTHEQDLSNALVLGLPGAYFYSEASVRKLKVSYRQIF